MENSEELTMCEKNACSATVNFLKRRDYEVIDEAFKCKDKCIVVAKDVSTGELVFVYVTHTDKQTQKENLHAPVGETRAQTLRRELETASLKWFSSHGDVFEETVRVRFDNIRIFFLDDGRAILHHRINILGVDEEAAES